MSPFRGVNAAVLTPFAADLSVDLPRMVAHAQWLLGNGVTGLGVLGTTGEANSLGVDERLALLEGLVAAGLPAERMLPGTGTPALPDTVRLTRRAAELGCGGALLLPPFFYKAPSEDGLFAYFAAVAERVAGGVPLYLYHFPAQSAVPITLALVARLRNAFPGVFVGLKDSSGDLDHTLSFVRAFAGEEFAVFCGDDGHLGPVLRAGGAGSISAMANLSGAVSARVVADPAGAAGPEALLVALRRAVTAGPLIPGLKALLARRWRDAAWTRVRPPHVPLADAAGLFATVDGTGWVMG